MNEFALFARTGLLLGITYGLLAYAFTMTYKSCRAFNFAVGQVLILGGLFYISAEKILPRPAAALASVLITALFGVVVYFLVVRRPDIRGAQPITLLILMLGVSIIIDRTIPQIWGYYALASPPIVGGGVDIGSTYIPYQHFVGGALGLVAIAVVIAFERRTMLGKAMIATGSAREAAITIGINDRLIQGLAWGMAFGLLAIAALVITPITAAGIVAAPRYSVLGISAAFIGGLGSGTGALLGGLVVGMGSAFIGGYISTEYADAILFIMIVLFLMTRPAGLVGNARALKGLRA